MLILATLLCIFWLFVLFDATLGMRKIEKLEDVQERYDLFEKGPLVSIIVAARNEATDIEASLRSQLKQTYPYMEWIVVNDRSTDDTGKIIDSLAQEDRRIKQIDITSLPQGWLGKNHALYQGYLEAKGQYLLFTDADVVFKEDTVAKALTYLREKNIDHLTLAPNLSTKRFWANSFISFFLFGFSYFKRPWKANDDNSKAAIGIGAFNLLSKEAYTTIGTHKKIAMRPDDDLMLGVNIKISGKKQRIVRAISHLQVEWYRTLKDAIVG